MRLPTVDEGKGPPLLLLPGERTWGFLWRKVWVPLLYAGFRCIVPALPGFGRPEKPADDDWYDFDRLPDSVVSLVDEPKLEKTTLGRHDRGGHYTPWTRLKRVAPQPRTDRGGLLVRGATPGGAPRGSATSPTAGTSFPISSGSTPTSACAPLPSRGPMRVSGPPQTPIWMRTPGGWSILTQSDWR